MAIIAGVTFGIAFSQVRTEEESELNGTIDTHWLNTDICTVFFFLTVNLPDVPIFFKLAVDS